eukprot:GHVL01045087.1.p1 GENE.GHVL01045087.1~~GHVL01045087.1.p1  ORF type:complete len:101 (-),score=2.60 GHVL01045087.1:1429-1731(-)
MPQQRCYETRTSFHLDAYQNSKTCPLPVQSNNFEIHLTKVSAAKLNSAKHSPSVQNIARLYMLCILCNLHMERCSHPTLKPARIYNDALDGLHGRASRHF